MCVSSVFTLLIVVVIKGSTERKIGKYSQSHTSKSQNLSNGMDPVEGKKKTPKSRSLGQAGVPHCLQGSESEYS